MDAILHRLEKEITGIFEGEASGHDLNHLKRVCNLGLSIQEREGGDRLVIGAAALVHDVHRIIQNQTGTFCSPKESLPRVRQILAAAALTGEQQEQILHCVEFHEEYAFSEQGKSVTDIETLILQDADNLDAIGAIGIGRTFAFGGSKGLPLWLPEMPASRETFDEGKPDPSTIHHFHSKLLKLRENMNTATARDIAAARHAFMERFLEEFNEEWAGRR